MVASVINASLKNCGYNKETYNGMTDNRPEIAVTLYQMSKLADIFETINPNFDRQRFIDACKS